MKNLPVGYFKDDQHFIRLIGVDIENCLDDGYRLVLTFDEETDA